MCLSICYKSKRFSNNIQGEAKMCFWNVLYRPSGIILSKTGIKISEMKGQNLNDNSAWRSFLLSDIWTIVDVCFFYFYFLYSLVIFLWRMIDIDHLFAPVNMNLNGFLWSMNSLHFLPSFQVCVTYFMISGEIQLGKEFLLIWFYFYFS